MKPLKNTVLALAGLGLSVLAGCGSTPAAAGPPPMASQVPEISSAAIAKGPDAPQEAAPIEDALVYRLDSGDRVKITVYGEPDLSGEFELDGQGIVQLSLIGEIDAQNKTVRELQRIIEARLRDGFIRDPQVSAEVTTYRPFYILGEVNKPGEYPYTSGLTVMNAIASAGDFTYRADKRKALIKSVDSSAEREVELSLGTPVRPGDTIRIRERFF